MAFNNNIKKFREEKNLTQQQLADKLYVSRQTVCRWENGSRCPDLITAKKLAGTLDVSMDELISDEEVNDIQVNYGIWKSERIKDKKHLQTLQKKILDFIQIVGAVFLAITILLRVQLDMTVPVWCTIIFCYTGKKNLAFGAGTGYNRITKQQRNIRQRRLESANESYESRCGKAGRRFYSDCFLRLERLPEYVGQDQKTGFRCG